MRQSRRKKRSRMRVRMRMRMRDMVLGSHAYRFKKEEGSRKRKADVSRPLRFAT